MITSESIYEALKKVTDPEIQIDIVTLGLVYDVNIDGDDVDIRMTLTSPMCPYGPMIIEDVKLKTKTIGEVNDVNVEVVFDPPWQPTEEVKMMLGIE